jgi:hypothetical protein
LIAKAPDNGKRGSDTYGLLRYLFGPGRANEHHDPHLVAAWDSDWMPDGLLAERQRGWLARLGREVDAPLDGHGVEMPGGHVYHVVLSVPEQDGALGDAVWRELVDEAVARMGFGPDAEGRGGCRWVAVHHGPSVAGNDHVHLVVNLVRGDGRIADTYRDWPRWRTWCLDVERRLGLTPTSPANKTAPLRPTRAETEKAARSPVGLASRTYLQQVVRKAAVQASTAQEFVALVREAHVQIGTRWGASGQLTGYKVALLFDRSRSAADGQVWFGGSRLARDLSAPKLMARWASAPAPPAMLPSRPGRTTVSLAERLAAIQGATDSATAARNVLAGFVVDGRTVGVMTRGGVSDVNDVEGIAHATLDLLIAAKALDVPGPGPIAAAATAYERAAAMPYRVQPSRWGLAAAELRTASRRMARAGVFTRRLSEGVAAAALVLAVASLIVEIAAWREQSGQHRQAAAARNAVALISADKAFSDLPSNGAQRRDHEALEPETITKPDHRQDQRRAVRGKPPTAGHRLPQVSQSDRRTR